MKCSESILNPNENTMTINEQVSLSLRKVDDQLLSYQGEHDQLKVNIASGLSHNSSYLEWLEGLLTGLKNARFELEEVEKCLLEER